MTDFHALSFQRRMGVIQAQSPASLGDRPIKEKLAMTQEFHPDKLLVEEKKQWSVRGKPLAKPLRAATLLSG
jgi:hypothetical protein